MLRRSDFIADSPPAPEVMEELSQYSQKSQRFLRQRQHTRQQRWRRARARPATPGVDRGEGDQQGDFYVRVTASEFGAVDLARFSALFIPSDHGGTLTGDDVAALNARRTAILAYVNAGGGLVALSQEGSRAPASTDPHPENFGFLPFLVPVAALSQGEVDFGMTPFGLSLGITLADVSGNFSHSYFTSTGGMQAVDVDAAGRIITLAGSGIFTDNGLVPEPTGTALAAVATIGAHLGGRTQRGSRRWRRAQARREAPNACSSAFGDGIRQ